MQAAILAIDQGTTSSRAIVFDKSGAIISTAQQEFAQMFPEDGWVEHDPETIWSGVVHVCKSAICDAIRKGYLPSTIGITNQRETTIVWERASGKAIYNAIVWQDRRTDALCRELKDARPEAEAMVSAKTGLLIDPYFSATKIAWILDRVEGSRHRAERGELLAGTVDSFLIWRLTEGRNHVTDATNASRTNIFNIHDNVWDNELLELFQVPKNVLPQVQDCASDFGTTHLFDSVLASAGEDARKGLPICGVAGDQQAALIGQACFKPGMVKSTYGTGCFMVLNTGSTPVRSSQNLLTTIGYRINGETCYALEGSIFIAGAAVQWLRDRMQLLGSSAESKTLAEQVGEKNDVVMVPAFTGMGAPYWNARTRGAVYGITRNTGAAEMVAAGLRSVVYQTCDLWEAIGSEENAPDLRNAILRVDGGMAANDWFLQFLADMLDADIERPEITETTALGAAYLAGLQSGMYASLEEISEKWSRNACYQSRMAPKQRNRYLKRWAAAVNATILFAEQTA
ncbi:MAG: glycerol kinase [unclassified Hahellaceae]|nr:glycerol kinase [Hahellaceae bacterium]